MSRVDGDAQRLAQARLALKTNPRRRCEQRAGRCPPVCATIRTSVRRARALRRAGRTRMPGPSLVAGAGPKRCRRVAERWWAERHIMAARRAEGGPLSSGLPARLHTALTRIGHRISWTPNFWRAGLRCASCTTARRALDHFRPAGQWREPPDQHGARVLLARAAPPSAGQAGRCRRRIPPGGRIAGTFYGQLALARIEDDPVLHVHARRRPTRPARAPPSKPTSACTRSACSRRSAARGDLRLFAVAIAQRSARAGGCRCSPNLVASTGVRR